MSRPKRSTNTEYTAVTDTVTEEKNEIEITESKSEVIQEEAVKPVQKPQKSARKVAYKEFIVGKGLNHVFLAGFHMSVNHATYLLQEEWERALKDYIDR